MEYQTISSSEFASVDFYQNPYPSLKKLRSTREPFYVNIGYNNEPVLFFTTYFDALEIFRQSKISNDLLRSHPDQNSLFFENMLSKDGVDHLRLRRLVSHFFSTQSMKHLTPLIETKVKNLSAKIQHYEKFDVMEHYATKLPVAVIGHLIGVPDEDVELIYSWSHTLSFAFDSFLRNLDHSDAINRTLDDFEVYIKSFFSNKHSAREGSILYSLLDIPSSQLSVNELFSMIVLLLFAGHETTTNLIGNSVLLLYSHKDQLNTLRSDRSKLPQAIDEVLRIEAPQQRSSFRTTTAPIEINGHKVKNSQQIKILIGSANRDELVFSDPDIFNIYRCPNNHLSFGMGLHNCLGKILARTEAYIALNMFLDLFSDIEFDEVIWRKNSFLRGLESLNVKPVK